MHLTNDELCRRLDLCPEILSHWRHSVSGVLYVVLGRAILEATGEPLVIYSTRQDSPIAWARPLREWTALVCVNGEERPRFVPV